MEGFLFLALFLITAKKYLGSCSWWGELFRGI